MTTNGGPDKRSQLRPVSRVPAACAGDCRFFREEGIGPINPSKPAGPLLNVARGTTIYQHEQPAHFCYKVIEGAVRLSRVLPDGRRQILEICLPQDTFGLETSDCYSATAEAIGDVVLLRCPRECIAELQDERPHTREKMLSMLSRGMCAAQDHVAMLGHQSAKERVACYLLRLADGHQEQQAYSVRLPIGRQDMADYLGMTIETTCRALSDLKAKRIISTPDRHRIVIQNFAALESVAEGS